MSPVDRAAGPSYHDLTLLFFSYIKNDLLYKMAASPVKTRSQFLQMRSWHSSLVPCMVICYVINYPLTCE